MSCAWKPEKLADLVWGFLEPAQEQVCQKHLATCPECRARVAQLAQAREKLGQTPAGTMVPDLTARVMARVKPQPESRITAWRWAWGIPVAATAAVLLLLRPIPWMADASPTTSEILQAYQADLQAMGYAGETTAIAADQQVNDAWTMMADGVETIVNQ